MFLDPLIKALRAPLDLVRSKVFGVQNLKGGLKGDLARVKQLGGEYKNDLGQARGAAGKIANDQPKKKKMGIFGKKKGDDDSAQAPRAQAQGGAPQRTMALDLGPGGPPAQNVGWLVPLEGTQAGELFTLRGRAIVGSAPDCDVVLTDPGISGRHAELVALAQGFRITDLGSTNGTFVNDKRVSGPQELVDNDTVRLGRTNFKFKSMN